MKKWNRTDKIFLAIGLIVLLAGLLHTGIAYGLEIVRQSENPYSTSIPSEIMLLLFVPYALALGLLAAIRFCLHARQRGMKGLDVAIRTCGVLAAALVSVGLLTVLIVVIASGGYIDFPSVCGVMAPFLIAAAPILLGMLVCFLLKKRRAMKETRAQMGENGEQKGE